MQLFVAAHLYHAGSSKRDDYKVGLCYQARKALIGQFMKAVARNKCENGDCGAHSFSHRGNGARKIVELDLSIKHRKIHAATGKKRPRVLDDGSGNAGPAAVDESSDEDMSDDDGESTHSFQNDDQAKTRPQAEEDHPQDDAQLPRTADGRVKTKRGRNERVVVPEECRAHLRRLFVNEKDMCGLLFGRHGPRAPLATDGTAAPVSGNAFFLEVLPVPPTRFRPPVEMGDQLFEHEQNGHLTKVINTSIGLRDVTLRRKLKQSDEERLKNDGSMHELLFRLQDEVNSFLDSSKNPTPMRGGKLPPPGVKQGLEKKEGLFRKHMMASRVIQPSSRWNLIDTLY